MIFSIILFFVIMFSLGFSLSYLLKLKFNNIYEKILMDLAIGLGTFPILSVLMNLLGIPLDWRLFLLLSIIVPIFVLIKNKFEFKNLKFQIKPSSLYIFIAVIIAFVLFLVYLKGAFIYPYLEDDDPWAHALGAKYIALEKTANEPANFDMHYIDPYPPSYDILMGVLHQTNESLSWTLKFFNVLIIALGIIFFYFFALQLTHSRQKSLIATFILAALPCFMSHFIWAQSLALVLFFPAWYCIEKADGHKKWIIPAAIISASIMVTQPSAAFNFVVMTAIYLIVKLIILFFNKSDSDKPSFMPTLFSYLKYFVIVVVLGSIYWIVMFLRYGVSSTLKGVGFSLHNTMGAGDTSGGMVYSLKDFIIAPIFAKMDQPTGLGIAVFIIVIIALVLLCFNYKKVFKSYFLTTSLLWLLFTTLGVMGNSLPIKLFPHRFWAFFAIPIVLLAAEGVYVVVKSFKNQYIRYILLAVVVVGVLWTSGQPKYFVETSIWPPGVKWSSMEEMAAFPWLKTLPPDTKVFQYINDDDSHVIGYDKYSCSWCEEVIDYRKDMLNKSFDELYDFLKANQYEYLVISTMSFRFLGEEYGENATTEHFNNLLANIQNSTRFSVAYQNEATIFLKVI